MHTYLRMDDYSLSIMKQLRDKYKCNSVKTLNFHTNKELTKSQPNLLKKLPVIQVFEQ